MNENDLVELIKYKNNCCFVAIIDSPWQVIACDATLAKLACEGTTLSGIIIIRGMRGIGKCIDKSFFTTQNKNIEFIEIENDLKPNKLLIFRVISKIYNLLMLKIDSHHNDIFYIICHSVPDYNMIRIIKSARGNIGIRFIVIEDGTYNYVKRIPISGFPEARRYGRGMIYGLYMTIKKTIKYLNQFWMIKYSKEMIVWDELLKYNGKKFLINNCYLSYVKNSLEKRAKNINIGNEFNGKIVFLSDYSYESKVFIHDEDTMLMDLFFHIADKAGVKDSIVIKPHPRENNIDRYLKYGCQIYDNNRESIEALICNKENRPKALVGIFSTALFHGELIYGIKAISLAKFMANQRIDWYIKLWFKECTKVFNDIVSFPETSNELEHILLCLRG